jgi:hypothetical protein
MWMELILLLRTAASDEPSKTPLMVQVAFGWAPKVDSVIGERLTDVMFYCPATNFSSAAPSSTDP